MTSEYGSCIWSIYMQIIITDLDGPIQRTYIVTIRASIINNPPVFSRERYRFTLPESARDNDEIGLITVTDDTGMFVHIATRNS